MHRLIVKLSTLRIHCLLGLAYVTMSFDLGLDFVYCSMQATSTVIFTTFSVFVLPHHAWTDRPGACP